MHKKTILIFIVVLLILLPFQQVIAVDTTNSDVGINYKVIIEDDAMLFTDTEKIELENQMMPLTEFGNVMMKTTDFSSGYNSLKYIQNYYYSKLGNEKGVAFYIDMNQRQVCACAAGGLDKIITSSKCDTIMDNVYTYAKKGQYYECAVETFSQMNSLLNGNKIAEPMKYICNGFLAIMISLFASYGFFMLCARNWKASQKELINECTVSLEHTPINVIRTGTHREYSPVSDSSSSGGSSGGGGRWWLFWKWRKSWFLMLLLDDITKESIEK